MATDKLTCDPNKDPEDEDESPFECAKGGAAAGNSQAQLVQQQMQQRAQMENQCNQSFEQARVQCDPESVVGFRGMLDEALAKAEKAKSASEKSLKQACDEYTQAFQQASSELKSFRQACSSAKSQCLGSCKQAVVENSGISPLLSTVGACVPVAAALIDAMAAKNIGIKDVQLKECTEFENVLAEADAKQQELVTSMRTADKCQSELQESCAANSNASHCRQLETARLNTENLEDVGTEIGERKSGPDLNPLDPSGGLNSVKPIEGNDKASVKTRPGGSSANVGSSGGGGGGGGGASGASGNYGYGSQYDDIYNSVKEGGFQKSRRGGGSSSKGYGSYRPKYRGKAGKSSRNTAGAKKGSGIDLKKYLYGASKGLVDGITPASGPGIFEKVSNRYRLKSPSLLRH